MEPIFLAWVVTDDELLTCVIWERHDGPSFPTYRRPENVLT